MTDNCPKLFKIDVNAYTATDYLKIKPIRLLSLGFSFSGSTLIGVNVKEMLATFLGNLNEVTYVDAPNYPFEQRIPSIREIAELAKKIGEKYIYSLGQNYPNNVRCEFALFGYCKQSSDLKAFKLSNSHESPTTLEIDEPCISNGSFMLLGDKKSDVSERIAQNQSIFDKNSLNWWRAPFITLANILRDSDSGTIGGYLQFCTSSSLGTRMFFFSPRSSAGVNMIGFDLFQDIGMIGGFLSGINAGMTMPDENGWQSDN